MTSFNNDTHQEHILTMKRNNRNILTLLRSAMAEKTTKIELSTP